MTNTRAANEALNPDNAGLEVQVKPLSDLSDFEINKRVGEITGQAKIVEPKFQAVFRSSGTEFNPCNRPEQAWPIIAEYEINILFNWNEEGLHGATGYFPGHECEHSNALRAAMCVFLIMQGVSNE